MQKGIAKSIVKKFRKTVLDNTASSGNGIMGNSTKNMTANFQAETQDWILFKQEF